MNTVMDPVIGTCRYEEVSSADLLDGLETLEGGASPSAFAVEATGGGVDRFVEHSIQEIVEARASEDEQDRSRHISNAVVSGRRALSCLVDWYLKRDGFDRCRNPPTSASQKAARLLERGIGTTLLNSVVSRAVGDRNRLEHAYVEPTLDRAEDIVVLFALVVDELRNHSDPGDGPFIWPGFAHSIRSSGDGNYKTAFGGWSHEPVALFYRFEPRPWIGVIIPEAKDSAVVRRSYIKNLDCDELAEILSLLDRRFGPTNHREAGEEIWRGLLGQAGIVP